MLKTRPSIMLPDMRSIAGVGKGEKIEVEKLPEVTLDFVKGVLHILEQEKKTAKELAEDEKKSAEPYKFDEITDLDLRTVNIEAELFGGYDLYNELVSDHVPTLQILKDFADKEDTSGLTEQEAKILEQHVHDVSEALDNVKKNITHEKLKSMHKAELEELHDIIVAAIDRYGKIVRILGSYNLEKLTDVIAILYEYNNKIQGVDKTVTGISMVESEFLFIPDEELAECIDILFIGIGNPYFVNHVDPAYLLAARKLLIHSIGFYCYYGKEGLSGDRAAGTDVDPGKIHSRVRNELKKLLRFFNHDNKITITCTTTQNTTELVEFSIKSITEEAELYAMDLVRHTQPGRNAKPKLFRRKAKKDNEPEGFFKRLFK